MSLKGKCYCHCLIAIRSATRNKEDIYDSVEMNRQKSHISSDDSVIMQKNVAYEYVDY